MNATGGARPRRSRAVVGAALLAWVVIVLGGCAGRDAPEDDAAVPFRQAVADGDWVAACALLAPATRSEVESASGKPCAEGLAEESVPAAVGDPTAVDTYGRMAAAVFEDDTVFLTRDGARWVVLAAGCTPRPAGPHECAVKGG